MYMKYFKNVSTVEELKKVYKKLARENHPDMGGDIAIMQAINNEFDMLVATLPNTVRNTVNSFRSEFSAKVREFVKNIYPECKFSVTFDSASMCSEIHVTLMESPYRLNKTFDELTDHELYDGHYSYNYQFGHETDDNQKKYFLKNCYTPEITKIIKDVDNYVNSYRYDDSDGMIDYFDTNFYYFGCKAGKWNKEYVQNEARMSKKRKVLVEA